MHHVQFNMRTRFLLALLLAGGLVAYLAVQQSLTHGEGSALAAQDEPQQVAGTAATGPNCRYGIATTNPGLTVPWLPTFDAGWYLRFYPISPGTKPSNGAEFVHVLRMQHGVFDPPLSSLDSEIAENPGALWLVGSEMEVDHPESGDKSYPEEYAQAYHNAYTYIKQRDPSAQVGIGGMSMATPGRLQYLDKVWANYQQRYGTTMPIDVWSIHVYIFAERVWNSTAPYHGKIALGTDPYLGTQSYGGDTNRCSRDDVYCIAEHDSIEIFKDQITELRRWMKDHGQQNKPLILTEFSLLYQPGYADEFGRGWPASRVNAYMDATANWLETAVDPALGYPPDNNRLVQQWLWFSMKVDPGYSGYASNLLKLNFTDYAAGDLNALTEVGTHWRNKVLSKSKPINLRAVQAQATHVGTGTVELRANFVNNGDQRIDRPFQVTFYRDASLSQVIGSTTVNPDVDGCARRTYSATVQWNGLSPGQYNFWAKVDSENAIGESNEAGSDNVVSGVAALDGGSGTPPTATPTPRPGPTSTPTNTPRATATNTPVPTATNTPIPAGCSTGTALREWWLGVNGTAVSDLTSLPVYPHSPSGSDQPTRFEAPRDWADSYGTRMRAYLYAPTSGSYTFWIASDDNSELWLSSSDQPASAQRIASVPGYTAYQQWNKYAQQQSTAVTLQAGQLYYIEALQKEGVGGDHLSVAWQAPGGPREVIPGGVLCPFDGPQRPTVTPTATGTSTATPTQTPIGQPTATSTATQTPTAQSSPTATPAATGLPPTVTPIPTSTQTPIPDAQPPSVAWLEPVGSGGTYDFVPGEMVGLEAAANDNQGVRHVVFERWDAGAETWVAIATSEAPPYRHRLATSAVTGDWTQLTATAYDMAGNASARVHIWLRRSGSTVQPTPTAPPSPTPTVGPPRIKVYLPLVGFR